MILVEIYVAALDDQYDFELDENVKTGQIMDEICEMLCKKTKEPVPFKEGNFMLCSSESSKILQSEKTLSQNYIYDGSHLILV